MWDLLSSDIIIKSFRVCEISVATDGSEDNEIFVFKEDQGSEKRLALLQSKSNDIENEIEVENEEMKNDEFTDTADDEVVFSE